MSIIYKTTNLINGKIYIGQHFTSANDGYLGSGTAVNKSIKKHGKENFKRETLEYCTSANVNKKEIYWIKELSAMDRNVGYNLTSGGDGGNGLFGKKHPLFGKHLSDETKIKLSNSLKGKNNPFYGKKHSEETKIKMRIPRSEISKKKIKENHADISKEKHYKNKYYFNCSDGKNYWNDFTEHERIGINAKFRRHKTDNIIYKNVIINRIKK